MLALKIGYTIPRAEAIRRGATQYGDASYAPTAEEMATLTPEERELLIAGLYVDDGRSPFHGSVLAPCRTGVSAFRPVYEALDVSEPTWEAIHTALAQRAVAYAALRAAEAKAAAEKAAEKAKALEESIVHWLARDESQIDIACALERAAATDVGLVVADVGGRAAYYYDARRVCTRTPPDATDPRIAATYAAREERAAQLTPALAAALAARKEIEAQAQRDAAAAVERAKREWIAANAPELLERFDGARLPEKELLRAVRTVLFGAISSGFNGEQVTAIEEHDGPLSAEQWDFRKTLAATFPNTLIDTITWREPLPDDEDAYRDEHDEEPERRLAFRVAKTWNGIEVRKLFQTADTTVLTGEVA